MESQKVDMFIMTNGKFFEAYHLPIIREKMLQQSDERWPMLQMQQYKDPTTTLIISLVAGALGIDRFYIGDTGLGLAKLLTCGGFGIWAIVDWFLIMGAARQKNLELLGQVLY